MNVIKNCIIRLSFPNRHNRNMDAYLKKKIIFKLAPFITVTGAHKLFEKYLGGMGHILMFHRIVSDTNKQRVHNHLSLEITTEHLENIINYFIKQNYCFFSIDELYNMFISGTLPDKKFVVFTFDDGYRDNLHLAYPIFKKYKIPFTVYITTGIPNRTAILWWYILEDMIIEKDEVHFSWNEKQYYYHCKTSNEKEKTFELIQSFVHQNFNINNYLELFKELFKDFQTDLTLQSSVLGLSWDEIRILNKDPLVSIGAHTVNHFNLSKIPEEDLRLEILQSKIELEKQLGQPIVHFAYPYGKSQHAAGREFECVKSLGFSTATTTNMGNVVKENSQMLCSLPRININRVTNEHVLQLQTSGLLPLIANKRKNQ